ncbi:autotransporter adhesin [Actinobacillus equuli]|nr:autotransporter adhesin [Actinobacillus equuli]
MNHIYKVVWSTVTNSLVVVSELARSKGKAASTVSDVKDVSKKTAAVAVATALQVAAVGTIAIGSFAPMEANAIVAIGGVNHVDGSSLDTTVKAKSNFINGTIDDGTRAYNYYNPGNPGDGSNLYNQSKYVHGIAIGCHTDAIAKPVKVVRMVLRLVIIQKPRGVIYFIRFTSHFSRCRCRCDRYRSECIGL